MCDKLHELPRECSNCGGKFVFITNDPNAIGPDLCSKCIMGELKEIHKRIRDNFIRSIMKEIGEFN